MTHLNDLSKVYLENIAESAVPGKPAERLGAVTAIPKDERDAARERTLAKAMREKKAKRWWDDDGNNIGYEEGEVSGRFRRKRKSVKEALIGRQSEIDANTNGKIDAQDFKILRSTKKKKQVKEGFSNWRQDLSEVMTDDEANAQIKEKKIKNKIKTSAMGGGIKLGEAVENLGGTLLEVVEVDEIDFIVESVYGELLDEGYEEDDIEEALEYALTEAKVTFGHDTPTKEKRGRNLLGAVGRLARQKLSSKYRGAKKAVSSAAISGLRNVAKGALGAARKLEGDKKPHPAHKPTIRGPKRPPSAAGQRERVSSGSYTPPKAETKTEPKKSSQVSDPWEGSYKTQPKPSPKPSPKPQAKTSEPKSEGGLSAKQKAAAIRAQRRNINISPEDLKRVISNVKEDYYDLASKSVKPGKSGEEQKKTIETLAKIATTKKKTRNPVGTARRGSASFKPSSPEEAEANKKSWGDYWSSAAKGYKEQYEILEKAESEQQQKIFGLALSVKRGDTPRSEVSDRVLKIVDGMSEKEIRKFAKTKHEGLPRKVETKEEIIRQELITRMICKIEEQSEIYVDEAKLPKSEKQGKKQRQSKTLKLTDCDDCTHDQRHPDAAKIDVVNPEGEKTHSLTPGEFAKHQLPSGHKYGFDQFRKTKIVKDTTKPNKRVVGYLNREDYSVIDERIRRYPDQRGVTARGSMDDNRGFTQDMKSRIGVKNLKAVHFVGDIPTGTGPEKKATVVKHIVKKNPDAKEVHFVDDHPGNVKAVTDTLAKSGKTVKGKVGRTRETGPKVKGFVARPTTKSKGTVNAGEVVPVRLGGEGREGNRGIRSGTSPSKSPKETQRRRKQQRMKEDLQPTTPQQFAAQRQLAMAQKKLTAADQIALQKKKKNMQQTPQDDTIENNL